MTEGLSSREAEKLLEKFGPNRLPDSKITPPLILFLNQFKNLFSAMLGVAVILSIVAGDIIDGVLIFVILILNSVLGFWQEYKSSVEIRALRKFESPKSRVIRDGKEEEISSHLLVPGDIVILEAGDKIPADGAIIEGYEFCVNESSLTGESIPVAKSKSEKNNELFLGTWATAGTAKMQIVTTGKYTRFGEIAKSLETIKEELTPLEDNLNKLAIKITFVILLVALFIFVLEIIQGKNYLDVFFSSIALIVAAVPEGLPAIITVILAIGARRMYKKKALIRKMGAIENLGATNVICIDKTGTITKNEMVVRQVHLVNEGVEENLIKTAVLCNTASLVVKEKDKNSFDILGDIMEGALLIWAAQKKINVNAIKESTKIIKEFPFDSKRKMMSVIIDENGKKMILTKGAPDKILPLCNLTEGRRQEMFDQYRKMAEDGLRLFAIAKKDFKDGKIPENPENDLELLGLMGISDEPREEAKESIKKARAAGIEIVMITGDNQLTARAVAEEIELLKKDDEIITGEELDSLSDNELASRIDHIRIYAGIAPEHKLRVVQTFQKLGKIVAVTGDGVNDSLALKKANVGISMGTTGTDVAKESSDIIILDDNLSTIVKAIEQGRLIYSNIISVIRFLLTGNLSEVLLIAVVVMLGFPTPLLPAQLLWINFVTDGLPAISLAQDGPSGNEMRYLPRGKNATLFNTKTLRFIAFFATIISLLCIFAFIFSLPQGIDYARRVTFSLMIVLQMVFVLFIVRRKSITSNRYLLLSILLILIFQFLILYFPALGKIFSI